MNTEGKDCFLFSFFLRYLPLVIFFIASGNSIVAQGNLVIYPKRLVFDDNKKIEKLVLSNTGKDSAVYSISFVEYKMNENGDFKEITVEEPGLKFSSPYVRMYPRLVKLGPNESQILKVQTYNTGGLEEGEYRSHLYFRAEKEKSALGQPTKAKESIVSVKIEAIFGVSIACILRKGADSTVVSISDMVYEKSNENDYYLQFKVNRAGNMSFYGDCKVTYTSVDNKSYEVGIVKGIGVYTPGVLRNMKIKLNKPANVNFTGGSFKVMCMQNESKTILSEGKLQL